MPTTYAKVEIAREALARAYEDLASVYLYAASMLRREDWTPPPVVAYLDRRAKPLEDALDAAVDEWRKETGRYG
jgi:hypothetical protein